MKTNRMSRASRMAAILAATTFLIAADGAFARGNGGHDHDSANKQMKSRDSGRDRSVKQPSLREVRKDMSKGDMRSKKHQDRDAKRAEKKAEREAKRAEKMAEREAKRAEKMKDKTTTGTATTTTTTATTDKGNASAADAEKDLFGRGIVGRPITDQAGSGSPAPGSVTGPGAGNTVRPIIVPSSGSPAPGTTPPGRTEILQSGKVGTAPTGTKAAPAPGSMPGPGAANTVHPISSPPAGTVTISNGVNSVQIKDGTGGVTVSSTRPGTITVSNGSESKTLSGSSLTVSGAKGIGSGQGVQVGTKNGEGRTVVAIKPVTPPAGTVTISNGVNSVQIQDGAKGVSVYSSRPGTITVTNGTESKTFAGGSLSVSGTKNIQGTLNMQVGAVNGEGRAVVAIKPASDLSGPAVTSYSPLQDPAFPAIGKGIVNGFVDLGKGIGHAAGKVGSIFKPATAGPPPPKTSTTIQQ